MIKYLLSFLYLINIANAFSVSFPGLVKNKAVIKNINVKKLSDIDKKELKLLFNIVPFMVFKNQKVSPFEYHDFVKIFDDKYNYDILHPWYTSIPKLPQVSLRGNVNITNYYGIKNKYIGEKKDKYNYFKYNYVWHQDLVGHSKYLPPIVSSMYMLKTPKKNKISTVYASLEDAYDMMDISLKREINDYNVIYSNSLQRHGEAIFDHCGYIRKDCKLMYNDDNTFTKEPVFTYSDKTKYRKSLMLNPTRFLTFDKLSFYNSNELLRHIMKKYVMSKDNIFKHEWDKNDLIIWNNRKLMHTSIPSEEYNSKIIPDDRLFIQCFLATDEPIFPAKSFTCSPLYKPTIVDIAEL